ncbi:hypothetical protein [Novosphingobium aquimarinum]|uniref:hypothetical protein n=1 Tax=Novosphingobium aquimarinum TaxID=2682494 RepID=UPI0012ECA934|nr:hypothetical protein [Novosphingobium aquimarinum]
MNRKKPVSRPSLTRHPLFPAIVALWFAALFGLGSLAIRPALIEQMVLAGGIDSVIPMAAPPLGVTTRILLALAMTGLGGLIGGLIARQISRPSQEKPERRRAPKSASVHAAELPEATTGAASPRRRALAMQEDTSPLEARDNAPVPGHSARILDVTEFELEGFEQLGDDEPELADADDDDRAGAGNHEPYDHEEYDDRDREPAFLASEDEDEGEAFEDAFREQAAPARSIQLPADAQVFAPNPGFSIMELEADLEDEPVDEAADEETTEASAEALDTEPTADEADRQAFQAPPFADSDVAFPDAAPTSETASRSSLNNRLFEAYSREIASRAERATAAAANPLFKRTEATTAEPNARLLPRLALGDWDETELDETSEAAPEHYAPLFPRSIAATHEATEEPAPFTDSAEDAPAAAPDAPETEPTMFEVQDDEVTSQDDALEEPSEEEAQGRDDPAPLDTAEIDGRDSTAAERIASSELDELSPVELLERLAMSMARRRLDRATAVGDASAPEAQMPTAEAPAEDPSPMPNPWSDILPIPSDVSDEPEESDEPEDMAPQPLAMPRTIPAALRPVSFEADGEDDELPGYVPPRSIGMAMNTSIPAASRAAADTDEDEGDGEEDAEALEEGYSSLLNLSRPFDKQFVRIDEPETSDEVQPFVVFPGEDKSVRKDDAAAFDNPFSDQRPFDPPAAAESRDEAEETERRLRAALANLQRISGAA